MMREDTAGAALLGPDWQVTPKLLSSDDRALPRRKRKPRRIKVGMTNIAAREIINGLVEFKVFEKDVTGNDFFKMHQDLVSKGYTHSRGGSDVGATHNYTSGQHTYSYSPGSKQWSLSVAGKHVGIIRPHTGVNTSPTPTISSPQIKPVVSTPVKPSNPVSSDPSQRHFHAADYFAIHHHLLNHGFTLQHDPDSETERGSAHTFVHSSGTKYQYAPKTGQWSRNGATIGSTGSMLTHLAGQKTTPASPSSPTPPTPPSPQPSPSPSTTLKTPYSSPSQIQGRGQAAADRSWTKRFATAGSQQHTATGIGVSAALGAIDPGLGLLATIAQKTGAASWATRKIFGASNTKAIVNSLVEAKLNEDTSQTQGAMLYGYHRGFWTVNSGPNQPTVTIPSHQVYGQDGVTKVVGRPGMKGRIVKTKKGPAFHSTDDGGPVSNPTGGTHLTIGVDYAR